MGKMTRRRLFGGVAALAAVVGLGKVGPAKAAYSAGGMVAEKTVVAALHSPPAHGHSLASYSHSLDHSHGSGIAIQHTGDLSHKHSEYGAGAVMLWPGSSVTPAGWRLCDGTNGTPDLRGRLV